MDRMEGHSSIATDVLASSVIASMKSAKSSESGPSEPGTAQLRTPDVSLDRTYPLTPGAAGGSVYGADPAAAAGANPT